MLAVPIWLFYVGSIIQMLNKENSFQIKKERINEWVVFDSPSTWSFLGTNAWTRPQAVFWKNKNDLMGIVTWSEISDSWSYRKTTCILFYHKMHVAVMFFSHVMHKMSPSFVFVYITCFRIKKSLKFYLCIKYHIQKHTKVRWPCSWI